MQRRVEVHRRFAGTEVATVAMQPSRYAGSVFLTQSNSRSDAMTVPAQSFQLDPQVPVGIGLIQVHADWSVVVRHD